MTQQFVPPPVVGNQRHGQAVAGRFDLDHAEVSTRAPTTPTTEPDADAITVTVQVSGRGQTGDPSDAHLTTDDGALRWFTFCA